MRAILLPAMVFCALTFSEATAGRRVDELLIDCEGRDRSYCAGYIAGFYDGRTTDDYGLAFFKTCPPTSPDGRTIEVTYQQMVRVFVKWARANPEQHDSDDWYGVRAAFAKAWPCQE